MYLAKELNHKQVHLDWRKFSYGLRHNGAVMDFDLLFKIKSTMMCSSFLN